MTQQLKVVVADDSDEFGQSCVKTFGNYGMDVVLCKKDGSLLLRKAKSVKPDIILADVFMPNLDILGVKSGLEQSGEEKQPLVMAMSALDNQRLEKQMLDAGISYYFLMPFDLKTMAERMLQLSGLRPKPKSRGICSSEQPYTRLEIDVTEILHKIGVPPNIRGFRYLREAIMLCITTPKIAESVTGSLYPAVATKFLTTATRVERAMRHAIEVACDRGNLDAINEYFSFALQGERGKPTNSEFVALISDSLRLKLKSKYISY